MINILLLAEWTHRQHAALLRSTLGAYNYSQYLWPRNCVLKLTKQSHRWFQTCPVWSICTSITRENIGGHSHRVPIQIIGGHAPGLGAYAVSTVYQHRAQYTQYTLNDNSVVPVTVRSRYTQVYITFGGTWVRTTLNDSIMINYYITSQKKTLDVWS